VVCVRARCACVRAECPRARSRARVAPLSLSFCVPPLFLFLSARRALFRSPSLRAVLPIPLSLPSFLTRECAARLHPRVRVCTYGCVRACVAPVMYAEEWPCARKRERVERARMSECTCGRLSICVREYMYIHVRPIRLVVVSYAACMRACVHE